VTGTFVGPVPKPDSVYNSAKDGGKYHAVNLGLEAEARVASGEEGSEAKTSGLDDSFEGWKGSKIQNCKDLLYKITLSNTRTEPIYFKIHMSELVPNSDINLNWPRCGVKGALDVGETAVVCLLGKVTPTDNLGVSEIEKLKVELKWKLNE
jgi:hypothetical protein